MANSTPRNVRLFKKAVSQGINERKKKGKKNPFLKKKKKSKARG